MASRSDLTTGRFGRRSRIVLSTVAISLGVVVSGVISAPGASAAPADLEAAKEKVDKLREESAHLDQDLLEAEEKLSEAKKALESREGDETKQREKVDKLKEQLRQVALAQYQDRTVDPSARVIFSSDADNFVSRFSTIQHVTDSQNGVLQDFQASEASLATMRRESEADLAVIAEQENKVKEAQEQSDAKLEEAEQVLNRLTEEERKRLEEEERQRQAEADAAANEGSSDSAGTSDSDSGSGSSSTEPGSKSDSDSDSDDPTAGIPDSDRVGKVLAAAKAQKGKPYVRGGNGPGSFDCSGLTRWAYNAAGVSLPRVSRQQINVGTRVSRGELKPGDLVFYYSPISHVAIYVGNGQIIHASRPGKPLGYAPVDSMPFAGATRVL